MEQARLRVGGDQQKPGDGARLITLKFRNEWEYFQRGTSKHCYPAIDAKVAENKSVYVEYTEHESGPELLVWAAWGTVGLGLAREIVSLVREILAARRDGVSAGDPTGTWIRITVILDRRDYDSKEVTAIEIPTGDLPTLAEIADALDQGIAELTEQEDGSSNS